MRATVSLALLGAVTQALANAQPQQLQEPVAVALASRYTDTAADGTLYQVDATSDLKGQAAPASAVISETDPERAGSWAGINTTVTVEAVPWPGNATNTPTTPLSTDDADKTDSKPAEVTGGAFPQPMKASAAGLLGFFIMSLVML
ncbi:hypothetical protein NLU13_3359 [Sarocladium strictum]|uniref:Uncharacterized protein n=1 Tax=Sarocladium strictum TaxID=5046 RepID=A0AA39GML0_SARSR|nr:hypothetical protein NLU13_3359 [Sarocladium strictum]